MSESNCPYCNGGEALAAFAIKITDLSPCSSLYLFKEQSHLGRVVVAYRGHVSEIVDLAPDQLRQFMEDVARVGRLVHKVFQPDKINYGAFGDTNPHLHFHMVPKYRDGYEWGGIFQMNPQKKLLTQAEYDELIAKISAALPTA